MGESQGGNPIGKALVLSNIIIEYYALNSLSGCVLHVQYKGTTINDLGGGGQGNPEKTIWRPFSRSPDNQCFELIIAHEKWLKTSDLKALQGSMECI